MINNLFFRGNIKFAYMLIIALISISCENDIAVVNSLTVDETTPIESSYNVEMNYTDSGKNVMTMHSPEVHRYPTEEEYLEMPKGMKMVFYDDDGKVKSDLKSEYAINFVDKKIMEARINVVATNKKGDKLFTELLTWDQNKKTIHTDVPVRVIQDGKTLFGDGLIADETFTDYEIINPHGEFDIESDNDNEVKEDKPTSNTTKKSNTKKQKTKKKEKSNEEEEFGDFDSY